MRNILLINPSAPFFETVRDAVQGARVRAASHDDAALRALAPATPDLIIYPHQPANDPDWQTLREIRKAGAEIPILVVLDSGNEVQALAAMKNGASDFIVENAAFASLLPVVIDRCLEKASLRTKLSICETDIRRLEDAQRTKTAFLSRMTHDLRTPLVGLRIYTQFLASGRLGPLAPVQKEKVEAIYRNAERLTHCIESIQRFQRLESPEMQLVPTDFDLRGLLGEAICAIMPACMEKGITIGQSFPNEAVSAHADRDLILEAVRDLLDNAVNFTDKKGSISVNVAQMPDRRASISITDSGCGMSPEKLKGLFEPSKRPVDGSNCACGGMGLGLRMVKRILEAHQSSLSVDSSLGGGTRVRFALPPAQATPVFPRSESEYQARRRVVLIVDDDEDNLSCTRSVLEYGGYDVLSADSTQEAKLQLDEGRIDAVLLDIALRGADGLETLQALKKSAATSSIPVVMVSARSDDEVRAKAAHMGAAGFVVKPFIPAKLLRELSTVMETGASA